MAYVASSQKFAKVNGSEFLPKTLYEIVMCLQMHLESLGLIWKLLHDTDRSFVMLKFTVDNVMKEHASSGMGCIVKQAKVLSYDDEEILWQKGYLGSSNPTQLVKILLFLIGMQCALYAGSEHHNLHSIGRNSQFRLVYPNGV